MTQRRTLTERQIDAKRRLENDGRAWTHICAMTDQVFHHVRGGARSPEEHVAAERVLSLAMYRWLLPAWMLNAAGDRKACFMPLPGVWRRALSRSGVQSSALSALAWFGLGLALIAQGVRRTLEGGGAWSTDAAGAATVVVGGSAEHMWPPGIALERRTWYLQSALATGPHSTDRISMVQPGSSGDWAPPLDPWPRLMLLGWTLMHAVDSALRHVMGDACAAAGFKDRVEARWMSRVPLHRMARRYVFLNSQYCYRPLWTTVAEARGARVELLFYSANTESIRFHGWDPEPIPGYRGMRWPRCLVWDKAQADFVREVASASTECQVIGPVSLSDDATELPAFAMPALAVFDVPVQTDQAMASKGIAGTYYSPQTVAAFIEDVTVCAKELGVCAVLKGKRDLGANIHPEYRRALERAAQRGAIALNERVAAGRLLEHVQAAVSIPFTSPAINGILRGMPSVYYDPTGTVTRPQRADHGVEVLHGRQELRLWMSRHLQCALR